MVFRTVITNDDLTTETLQLASQPIACSKLLYISKTGH